MAAALDEILGDHLSKGIAIVKVAEEGDVFRNTDVYVGGHPLPNQTGYEASLKILELADEAGPDDLFIAVISGGSSALMSCPVEGISLQDEIDATDVLLKSGAGIYEINAIRRHISQTNGGMLAKRIQASGAELIGFGISDAVGNPPTGDIGIPCRDYASTPIGPDKTTLADARRVIADYDLADRLPPNVVRYLMEAGEDRETPKAFPDNTYYLLNTVPDSCIYAKEVAEEMGIAAYILTSFLEGESKDAGTFFASLAREVQAYGNPFPAPCVDPQQRGDDDEDPGELRHRRARGTVAGAHRELRHQRHEGSWGVHVLGGLGGDRRDHSRGRRAHRLQQLRDGRGERCEPACRAAGSLVLRGVGGHRRHRVHWQHGNESLRLQHPLRPDSCRTSHDADHRARPLQGGAESTHEDRIRAGTAAYRLQVPANGRGRGRDGRRVRRQRRRAYRPVRGDARGLRAAGQRS